jgi:RNA polymerase sigma-70 factor (ECF subfamily)
MDASPRQELVERIYGSHRPSVRSFFRRALRSEQDADDLTQDTFLRAHRSASLEDLRNPGAFLLQIARNLLRDRFRRERLVSFQAVDPLDERDLTDPSGTPEEITHARRELRALSRALLGLPERTRQAVILHKFHHLTYRQVAAVMGTSPKTVEKQIASGIAACRTAVRGGAAGPGAEVRAFRAPGLRPGDEAAGRGRP